MGKETFHPVPQPTRSNKPKGPSLLPSVRRSRPNFSVYLRPKRLRKALLLCAISVPLAFGGCIGKNYDPAPGGAYTATRADATGAFNACMAMCSEDTALALVTRTGCVDACRQALGDFPLQDKLFDTQNECYDAFVQEEMQREKRVAAMKRWCDAKWSHVHNRKGCYLAAERFYASLAPSALCGGSAATDAHYAAALDRARQDERSSDPSLSLHELSAEDISETPGSATPDTASAGHDTAGVDSRKEEQSVSVDREGAFTTPAPSGGTSSEPTLQPVQPAAPVIPPPLPPEPEAALSETSRTQTPAKSIPRKSQQKAKTAPSSGATAAPAAPQTVSPQVMPSPSPPTQTVTTVPVPPHSVPPPTEPSDTATTPLPPLPTPTQPVPTEAMPTHPSAPLPGPSQTATPETPPSPQLSQSAPIQEPATPRGTNPETISPASPQGSKIPDGQPLEDSLPSSEQSNPESPPLPPVSGTPGPGISDPVVRDPLPAPQSPAPAPSAEGSPTGQQEQRSSPPAEEPIAGPPVPGLNANRPVPPQGGNTPETQMPSVLMPPVPSMLDKPYEAPTLLSPQIDIPPPESGQ